MSTWARWWRTRARSSPPAGSRLLPMVKANGYGLGAVAVARALEPLDPWGFGVATVEEGAALRAAGITPAHPASPARSLPSAIDAHLEPRSASRHRRPGGARGLVRPRRPTRSTSRSTPGWPRAGVRWDDAAGARATSRSRWQRRQGWEGAFTHFHSARTPIRRPPRSSGAGFRPSLDRLPRRPPLVHAANSAAALQGRATPPTWSGRASSCTAAAPVAQRPRPVAALRARVVAVRTLGAGDTVSYGATWRAPRRRTVATLAHRLRRRVSARHEPGATAEPRLVELGGSARAGRRAGDDGHDAWSAVDDRPVALGRCGDDLRRARLPRPAGRGPPAPSPTSC